MTTYLTNTCMIPRDFVGTVRIERMGRKRAYQVLSRGFVSAVDNAAMSLAVSGVIGLKVEMNHIDIKIQDGDLMVVFQTEHEFPDGRLPTWFEICDNPYEIRLLRFLKIEGD